MWVSSPRLTYDIFHFVYWWGGRARLITPQCFLFMSMRVLKLGQILELCFVWLIPWVINSCKYLVFMREFQSLAYKGSRKMMHWEKRERTQETMASWLSPCSGGVLRGQVKERWNSQGEVVVSGVASTALLGEWLSLAADSAHLGHPDKWGSFVKETTALLKSIRIDQAIRKLQCVGDSRPQGPMCPSGSALRSFLNIPRHPLWLLGPHCMEPCNKYSVTKILCVQIWASISRHNGKKPRHYHR